MIEPRQVFHAYDPNSEQQPRYRFCTACGASLSEDEHPRCQSCGQPHYRNPSPGVVVLIEDDRKVLLGKRGPSSYRGGSWCFPGGFVEYGEDFLTAAVREVKEETNLDVEITSIVSVISNFFSPSLHTVVINLIGRVIGGQLHAGDDIVDLGWFPVGGPYPELAFEAESHILERYFSAPFVGAPVDPRYCMTR